jgi:hypothetical protein
MWEIRRTIIKRNIGKTPGGNLRKASAWMARSRRDWRRLFYRKTRNSWKSYTPNFPSLHLIKYGPQRKYCAKKFFYCYACIQFFVSLPNIGLPSGSTTPAFRRYEAIQAASFLSFLQSKENILKWKARRLKIEDHFLLYTEKYPLTRRYEPLAQRGWRAGISSVDFTRCVRTSALFLSYSDGARCWLASSELTTILTLTYTVSR